MSIETEQYRPELEQGQPPEAIQEQNPDEQEKEQRPDLLMDTEAFAKNADGQMLDEIYRWYEAAMSRRNRVPLPQENFERHFFEGGSLDFTYMYGDQEKGYLLGYRKHGIFIPTHFAPKTLRGGYNLFRELANSKEIPVVTAVTEDLAETLKKMKGWKTLNIKLLAYLNQDLLDKTVVYNSYPKIRRKMAGLVKEFLLESKQLREKTRQEDSTPDDEIELKNE